jgi:hypothetical protein
VCALSGATGWRYEVPLTCETLTRRACALFVAVALVVVAAPVTAIAATPVTMLLVDGGAWVPGTWYNPEPAVTLSSSENGVAFWSWNGGAVQSAAISAGTPLEVGPVPAQGESYLRFRTVNADGEEPTASASVRADWTEPSRPDSLEATIAPMEGGIDLAWTVSTDPTPGSGVAHYVVYRHQGPDDPSWIPSPADKVAEPTDAFYRDLPPANEDFYTYVVEAHDAAGNESFLSLSASAFWQSGPPTDPTDVYAWLNAAGDVRLLWGASTDLGSGLASYEVSRSVEGGPWEVRANPVAADTVWVDVLPGATVLEYGIRALDRVGFGSNAVTVTAGVDTTGPVLGALTATPAYAPPGSGSYFDPDSGVESVALDYGPVGGPSSRATSTGPGALRVGSPAESAYYEFLLTASDRAGNVTTYPASARHVTVDRLTVGDPVYASIEWSRRTFGSAGTVVLVGAGRYWDALAASSLAGRVGGPVLMVGRTLDGATAAEIRRLGARRAYLIGGTGGVPVRAEVRPFHHPTDAEAARRQQPVHDVPPDRSRGPQTQPEPSRQGLPRLGHRPACGDDGRAARVRRVHPDHLRHERRRDIGHTVRSALDACPTDLHRRRGRPHRLVRRGAGPGSREADLLVGHDDQPGVRRLVGRRGSHGRRPAVSHRGWRSR